MWSELGHHIVLYVHGYECFGGAFWVCLQRPSDEVGLGQIVCADRLDYMVS
jgi:hypothetical protein